MIIQTPKPYRRGSERARYRSAPLPQCTELAHSVPQSHTISRTCSTCNTSRVNGKTPCVRRRINWGNLRTLLLFRHELRVPGTKVNLIAPKIPEDTLVERRNDGDLPQAWIHLPTFHQSQPLFLMIVGPFKTTSLDGPNGYLRL